VVFRAESELGYRIVLFFRYPTDPVYGRIRVIQPDLFDPAADPLARRIWGGRCARGTRPVVLVLCLREEMKGHGGETAREKLGTLHARLVVYPHTDHQARDCHYLQADTMVTVARLGRAMLGRTTGEDVR
jgi:hypothetical protein